MDEIKNFDLKEKKKDCVTCIDKKKEKRRKRGRKSEMEEVERRKIRLERKNKVRNANRTSRSMPGLALGCESQLRPPEQ